MNTWEYAGRRTRVSRLDSKTVADLLKELQTGTNRYGLKAPARRKWISRLQREQAARQWKQLTYCLHEGDSSDYMSVVLDDVRAQFLESSMPVSVDLIQMEPARIDAEMEAQCALEALLENLNDAYTDSTLAPRLFSPKDLPESVRKQFYKTVAAICSHFPVSTCVPTGHIVTVPLQEGNG